MGWLWAWCLESTPLAPGSPVHIVTPGLARFASATCVWLKVWGGGVLWDDHFLMTIWEASELETPDPHINDLCDHVFCSFLKSLLLTISCAFLIVVLLVQGWEMCVYLQFPKEWTGQSLSFIS